MQGGYSTLDGGSTERFSGQPPHGVQNTIKNLKSMHVAVRKNELNRIERENAIMAKKIYFAAPKLESRKNMEQQFSDHQYMSKNMSKIKRRTIGPSHPTHSSIGTMSRVSVGRGGKNSDFTLPPINTVSSNTGLLNTDRSNRSTREGRGKRSVNSSQRNQQSGLSNIYEKNSEANIQTPGPGRSPKIES